MVDATGLEPVANILEALDKTATSKSAKKENAPKHAIILDSKLQAESQVAKQKME